MIRTTMSNDGPLTFNATVSGLAVYLDNWAVIDLAKGDPSRRRRFVDALHSGADLLFSVTNAAELAGPQGRSAHAARTFLDELGPHWFPVELNTFEVLKREWAGSAPDACCVSSDFMRSYFRDRTKGYTPGSGKIISLSDDFFRLGAVLDWVGPQRESILKTSKEFDAVLKTEICVKRLEYERNPSMLEKGAAQAFNPSRRATFACVNLVRTLIVEAKGHPLKPGDALDFSHAVMASAFATVATLDKHWKRRVEGLPKPNGLARIYYQPELDQMVTDIESWVKQGPRPEARIASL